MAVVTRAEAGRRAPPALAGRLRQGVRRNAAGYLFLLPWLIGFFVLTLGPTLASLYLSFTDYDLLPPPRWVGLDNYVRMLPATSASGKALRGHLHLRLWSVPLKLIFALGVAMMLDQRRARRRLVPRALLPAVAARRLGRHRRAVAADSSAATASSTSSSRVFGIQGPSWVSHPDYALSTLIMLAVWQFGSPMMIFLAGLRQIPQDLYEAACDGRRRRVRQFFAITLPLLAPVIFFNLVLQRSRPSRPSPTPSSSRAAPAAPIDSTLFYTLYLYKEAFAYFRMGYASALAWVLLLIIALFTAIASCTSKYWVYYEDEDAEAVAAAERPHVARSGLQRSSAPRHADRGCRSSCSTR